jgi:hypothetical protein
MQSGKFRRKLQEALDERTVFKGFINFLIGGCLVLLAGCTTVDNSQPTQSAVVKPVAKSIVVFRVAATTDYLGNTNPTAQPFVAHIGRLDDHEAVETISSGDDQSWHRIGILPASCGWGYVELKPGLYYLQIKPTFGNVTVGKVDAYPVHSYFLNVPPGKPVIYAGSFDYVVTDVKEGHWKLKRFWGTMHVHCEELGIARETDEARQASGDPWAKEIEPIFPLDYDNLSVALGSLTNRQIAQIEAGRDTALTNDDVGSDVTSEIAGPVALPLMAFGMVCLAASEQQEKQDAHSARSDPDDAYAELAMDVVGAAAMVVAVPVVSAVDKTFGDAARKKWAPHAAVLAKEFANFNLPQQLVNETSNRLSSVHPENENTNQMIAGSDLAIQIQPYRVLLRETRHKKFALEIGVQVALIDTDLEVPLWQHDYVYSDAEAARSNPSFLPAAYETLINAQSKPHALEDYENASGGQLLHEQLTGAVAAIGRDVAVKFHDAGFYH